MSYSRAGWRACWLCRSAKTGGEAGICSWTKRSRLEDSERAIPSPAAKFTLTGALLCVGLLLPGCLSDSFEVKQPLTESLPAVTLASEVLLEVDDTALKWGSGKVGEALSAALVKNQTFRQVHYPIYPSHKVPLKLKVVASGGIASEKGLGMVKAVVTGLLFFLPVGVIQYEDTFSLTGSVSLVGDRHSYGPLTIQSAVEANHNLFASPEPYARRASALALEDFANRV
jgi:hypothetical protein